MVRAVGIDLSLTATGIAHSTGACALVGRQGITSMSVVEQMDTLSGLARTIVAEATRHGADIAVIEGLDMARSYGGQIERTVLWWEVVRGLRFHNFMPEIRVAPSALAKIYATGSARATKPEMVTAISTNWPAFDVRGNDNLADAAAMCAMALHHRGVPLTEASDKQAGVVARMRSITESPPKRATSKRRAT